MSAETLRRAASLMRERAKRAVRAVEVDGPWGTSWDHQVVASDGAQMADCFDSGLLATHIASWHPVVALAVADWLDNEAESFDSTELWFHPDDGVSIEEDKDFMFAGALAVARAYLGSAS